MSTVLGKRKKTSAAAAAAAPTASKSKTRSTKATTPVADTADDAIQDIFRRHFEAQFKPLADVVKTSKKTKKTKTDVNGKSKSKKEEEEEEEEEVAVKGKRVVIRENESDDDDDGSDSGSDSASDNDSDDWSGLSGDEDTPANDALAPAVQVVDYSAAEPRDDPTTRMSKHERKLYLSSKVPASLDVVAPKPPKTDTTDFTTPTYKDAPELLANDLALQRLISESHLLCGAFALPSSFSTAAGAAATFGSAGTSASKHTQPFAAGRLRQRTTDLRIQAVANKARGDGGDGSLVTVNNTKESIFTQQKMPMGMRKGIAAAAAAREAKRRQEARESGIVLERPQALVSKKKAKRQRAVDAPAVGILRGSELKLRDKDIRAIEGPKKTVRGGKGGKGGRGGKR